MRRTANPLAGTARAAARAAVTLAIAWALVLSPWLPSLLPAPAPQLGTPPALAQTPTGVFNGMPSQCPIERGWAIDSTDASLCKRSLPPCPPSPLKLASETARYTTYSTEYPDFCEDTIHQGASGSETAAMYARCENTAHDADLRGFAVKVDESDSDTANHSCRAILPARCPAGMHKVSASECRQYRRRTWTCPGPRAVPRNEFNSCYRAPSENTTNPACQAGSPQLTVRSCEAYVGADLDPISANCGSSRFDTGVSMKTLADHADNNHWCTYSRDWLSVECHATMPPQSCSDARDAMCIKRASQTGGCDAIAQTITCRKLQAGYRAAPTSDAADTAFSQGCSPCVALPFDRTSSNCQVQGTGNRRPHPGGLYAATHRVQDDFFYSDPACVPLQTTGTRADLRSNTACNRKPVCADPPKGTLTWETLTASGLATVGVPVVAEVVDLPTPQTYRVWSTHLRGKPHPTDPFKEVPDPEQSSLRSGHFTVWSYDVGSATPMRQWSSEHTTRKTDSVSELMFGAQECVVSERPAFKLIIQELWPDEDADQIRQLFGPQALAWWSALTVPQREALSATRGLTLTTTITDQTEKDAELNHRKTALFQIDDCNYDSTTWCRWVPDRSGFFRLTAAGAWHMEQRSNRKQWLERDQPQNFAGINALLGHIPESGRRCEPNSNGLLRIRDRACLRAELVNMGFKDNMDQAVPALAGINPSLTGLLTVNSDSDFLYSSAAAGSLRCPPRDLRVSCSSDVNTKANYTTTEPIGIVVHEARTVTVQPSQPSP